jgi:hypothetical protein
MNRPAWETVTALVGGGALLTMGAVILFAVPNPSPDQWFVFRIILSVAAAGFGAALTGLLFRQNAPAVRVLGAAALFAFVWFYNSTAPSQAPATVAESASIASLSSQSSVASEEQKLLHSIAPEVAKIEVK